MRPDVTDVDSPFLFIVGCGRSGTTMLRSMFDSHPDIAIPGESGFIWQRKNRYEGPDGFDAQRFVDYLLGHRRFRRWGLDRSAVRSTLLEPTPTEYADALRRLYRLYADSRGKERYGDKTPGHVLRIPLLADLFGEARVVHLIRDGRNVALSYMDIKEWGPSGVAEAARHWRRRVLQGRKDGLALGPDRYQEVTYEALVEDPETELRRLAGFADVAYHDSMLRYFERAPEVLTTELHPHRHQGLFKPPTKGLRDWRTTMDEGDVACFEAVAGETLAEFGYERRFERLSSGTRVRARVDLGASRLRQTSKLARGAGRKVQRGLRLSGKTTTRSS
jgi:Sulfotransferase family